MNPDELREAFDRHTNGRYYVERPVGWNGQESEWTRIFAGNFVVINLVTYPGCLHVGLMPGSNAMEFAPVLSCEPTSEALSAVMQCLGDFLESVRSLATFTPREEAPPTEAALREARIVRLIESRRDFSGFVSDSEDEMYANGWEGAHDGLLDAIRRGDHRRDM